jgi:hypothetical protein
MFCLNLFVGIPSGGGIHLLMMLIRPNFTLDIWQIVCAIQWQ